MLPRLFSFSRIHFQRRKVKYQTAHSSVQQQVARFFEDFAREPVKAAGQLLSEQKAVRGAS